MPTPAEMQTRTSLARFEAERLAVYLDSLSSNGWNHSTACDLWQVADVVAHLVWIGEFYIKFVTRSLAGDITPPPGSPKDEKYAGIPPEDFYDLTARQYRQDLGNRLLPSFVRRFEDLSRLLESLAPDDYEKPCFYHSGNRPVWTLADLTVQELAVHAWDIQSHTEPGTPLSPESQPVLLDRVVQRPQPALGFAGALESPAILRFNLSGSVNRTYDIGLSAHATTIELAGGHTASAVMECDTEAFIMMLYRRLKMSSAVANGLMSVSGDKGLVQAFSEAF